MAEKSFQNNSNNRSPYRSHKFLRPEQIVMIDEALATIGDFGEIRLVVEKGCLRFLVIQKSVDVLKWKPQAFVGETTN